MPKTKSVKRTKNLARSSSWLLGLVRWAWWIVVAGCLFIYAAGLWVVLQHAGNLPTLQELVSSEFSAQLGAGLASSGWSNQFFLFLFLLPEVIATLVYGAIGLLIRLNRPKEWFSLFASLWMIVFGMVSTTTFNSAFFAETGFLFIYYLLIVFAYLGILVFLMAYPDGRFQPGWMRWVLAAWGLFIISTLVVPWFNWESVESAFVIVPVLVLVLYSQVYRYRKVSTPAQRQQTKWLIVAIALNAILIVVTAVAANAAQAEAGSSNAVVYMLVSHIAEFLGNLLLVLAVGVAILRYRLWDIDVVVNRALIYGPLSVILAGVFAVSIVLINQSTQQLLGSQATGAAAVVSALLVATIFTPLRLRIEKWINARLYSESSNLARELVEITDPRIVLPAPALARLVAQRISRLLNSSSGAVYLAIPSRSSLRGAKRRSNPQSARSFKLAAAEGGKLATSFNVSPKVQQELVAGKISTEGPAHFLVPLYVPRLRSKELVGVLAVGERKNGRGYSSDDKKALVQLGGQVGTALYAAELRGKGR